jgi:hypothetical protein
LKSQFQLENNNKTLLHESIGVITLILLINETRRTMLMPFRMPDERRTSENQRVSREDFRRFLYPHHAQFWPEDLPEHVVFQEENRRRIQERRRAALGRILRLEGLRLLFGKLANKKNNSAASRSPATVCADQDVCCDHQNISKKERIPSRRKGYACP